MINVLDDVLPLNILNEMYEKIKKLPYVLGGSVHVYNFFSTENLGNFDYFNQINNTLIKNLPDKKLSILRSYANANNSGKNNGGKWHIDAQDGMTFLLYIHEWDKNLGGGTSFRTKDLIETVDFKKNRLVIFPSNLEHKADDHFKENSLRFSYAIKTNII
jgi:hypothetical protein